MFKVTIEGETLDDLFVRVRGLYQALTGQPAPAPVWPANEAPNAPETDPPKKTRGRPKKAAEPAETAEPETVAEPEAAAGGEDFDAVAAASIKEQALDKIRAVYATGPDGQAAVEAIRKSFNVKKLGAIDLHDAEKLLNAVVEAEEALKALPI